MSNTRKDFQRSTVLGEGDYDMNGEKKGFITWVGYSGSRKPPVRRNGNQLSGVWKPF